MSARLFPKTFFTTAASILALLLLLSSNAQSLEVDGEISVQGFLFFENGAWPHQKNQSVSGAITVKIFHEIRDTFHLALEPFYRIDSEDQERSHGDLRLAEVLYFTDNWEISVGLGRVFWGATEFVHLVDIINQTDQVEDLDGEEKLGQPMLHLTVPHDWGVVEAFVLPWFRERTFPGVNGRYRTVLPVDTDRAVYESGAGQHHTDIAIRYSTTLGATDLGLYYFNGTARDPILLFSHKQTSSPMLFPYYEQIGQTGLDLQMAAGEWLFKVEAYYRIGQSRSYAATTFGFEYTLVGIADTMMDLGLIGEYVYDDRDDGWLPTIYENDVMTGLRLAVNDMDDSNILLGVIRDIHSDSTIFAVEASRRLGDSIRINLDASFFMNMDQLDPAASLARDDSIKLEMVWYW
ncbi:hypothetical protein JYT85_00210 [Desulfocapsa sp. AH-315-G09]|uniref:Uncharacterized protein n=1 Tax=Desulfotalea psychrophila TaxID=84980 RepID=A0ABS3AT13_9BACT|nr:hypothetical protein [Desulfocapsa sp.]MBN4065053.1 hypothetical protein [Desulfocapsa sp. AH-315-G09]MBN4068077.1 hypothetical protein [Desulfotalea psychrophila]